MSCKSSPITKLKQAYIKRCCSSVGSLPLKICSNSVLVNPAASNATFKPVDVARLSLIVLNRLTGSPNVSILLKSIALPVAIKS